MGKLQVVVGGQYGSEAKGAVAAYLAKREVGGDRVSCVRVAGPNAGHTVWGNTEPGRQAVEFKLRQIPTGAVSNVDASLYVAAGSEVDPAVLQAERYLLDQHGYNVSERLLVDGQATILEPVHARSEADRALVEHIGSTGKGVGAARVARLWREAMIYGGFGDVSARIAYDLEHRYTVIVEGTQGYGLGLHAGEYPHCTSSDCRAIDFLGMAGVSPWQPGVENFEVFVVFRTRPIRVAGNSGSLMGETTWARLGLPEERTTVTNKVRRVGEWDGELARRAIIANGGTPDNSYGPIKVALMMVDHDLPWIAGYTTGDYKKLPRSNKWELNHYLDLFRKDVGHISLIGTGPRTIVDLREV